MAVRRRGLNADSPDETEVTDDSAVEVSLEDASDDDENPAEPQSVRREKKRARLALRDEAERARTEAEALRRELAETKAMAAHAAGLAQGIQQAGGKAQTDPEEAELEAVRKEGERLLREWEARSASPDLTDEERADFRRRRDDLKVREGRAIYRKVQREEAPPPQQAAQEREMMLLRARHPEVMSHQDAPRWAKVRYEQLILEGHPPGWDTTDIVMKEARARYKLGGARQDETLERKLTGHSKGAGGGGGEKKSVTLSKTDVAMANAAFGHIKDEKKRLQMYAKLNQRED